MRTKTMLLSALVGSLASVSTVMAQNVYSLNAVGYINVTLPAGFSIISCPLIASPDNTLNTLFPNTGGAYVGDTVWFYSSSGYSSDAGVITTGKHGTPSGWANGGTETLLPGTAVWFENASGAPITVTFVGSVPTGPQTNSLAAGFNLVGSVVPMSGDIITNSISDLTNYTIGDDIFVWDPVNVVYDTYSIVNAGGKHGGTGYNNNFLPSDPIVPNVGEGFWYENNSGAAINWVENYTVSQ
jgi:hypothetical protein